MLIPVRGTLQADRRALLERYSFVDMARKVVGVGSVGTRCWVVLLTGRDADDPLLLQLKEATRPCTPIRGQQQVREPGPAGGQLAGCGRPAARGPAHARAAGRGGGGRAAYRPLHR